MRDQRFRNSLPVDLKEDVEKYLENPSCGSCNISLYKKIIKKCKEQIKRYYPGKTIVEPEEEQINYWRVFSCNINELEQKLKSIPKIPKQIAMARWQDQITVVINELL